MMHPSILGSLAFGRQLAARVAMLAELGSFDRVRFGIMEQWQSVGLLFAGRSVTASIAASIGETPGPVSPPPARHEKTKTAPRTQGNDRRKGPPGKTKESERSTPPLTPGEGWKRPPKPEDMADG